MPPNTNNPNVQPQPQQPIQQSPNLAPAPAPAPPTPGQNQVAPAPQKSKIGLIIGIIAGVLLLLGVLFFAFIYFFYNSDAAVSSRNSLAFMTSMTKGDINDALTYTDGGDSNRSFLESMAPGMNASSLQQADGANQNGTWYYLYDLTGAQNSMARTQLQKNNGEWQVSALVTGDNLALIPGNGSESVAATTAQEPSGQCLVQSDFDEWYQQEYGTTATEQNFNFHDPNKPYTTNFKFQPDSLEYEDAAYNEENVDSITVLAKSVEGKQYTIRLQGSVATTAAADLEFSNQRADKIKAALVAKGVPESKIVVEEPSNVSDISDPSRVDETTKAMARNVVLKFDPTCTSGAPSDTGR
ncbi:hypothetical protein KC950_01885 [Candidatus Saccharibacteria bacterium]|nr:hypothetical protein [Candidatus Saccharibacteria bacterium]